MKKPWTTKELAFLVDAITKGASLEAMHQRLPKRSLESISQRCLRLKWAGSAISPDDKTPIEPVEVTKKVEPTPNAAVPIAFIKPKHIKPIKRTKKCSIRVIIPDSHGNHIDIKARDACIADIRRLAPSEIVFLGDHVDCGGTFSSHQRTYTNELVESYQADINAANEFLNLVVQAAPSASQDYLEGNHEQHVERWAARTFLNRDDAELLVSRYGPASVLQLEKRGIKYFKRSEHYEGISIPGCIRRGKCFFVHGISHSKHAASMHLTRFGANVVFGHVHRSQSVIERSVTSDGFGAWCPGTLAKLQPLYRHTEPSSWAHGYGVQFVNRSGNFLHLNVPILDGVSFLNEVADTLGAG